MGLQICPRCTRDVRGPGACDNCQFEVPLEWLTDEQVSIALTGARQSGKTVLIAVMMVQLKDYLEKRHKSFLNPLGDTATHFQEIYMEPLYVQRSLPGSTPVATTANPLTPMLWRLSINGTRYTLCLIDAAGEDFQDRPPQDELFSYLGMVDLVVSLIDPLKVPGVTAILQDLVPLPLDGGDDIQVMQRVLQAIAAHKRAEPKLQGLAITFNKFDALQLLATKEAAPWQSIMNRPGSTMQRDPSTLRNNGTGGMEADIVDGDLLNSEMHSLMSALGLELIETAVAESGMPALYFVASALGMHPTTETVAHGGISPFRVMDIPKALFRLKGVHL